MCVPSFSPSCARHARVRIRKNKRASARFCHANIHKNRPLSYYVGAYLYYTLIPIKKSPTPTYNVLTHRQLDCIDCFYFGFIKCGNLRSLEQQNQSVNNANKICDENHLGMRKAFAQDDFRYKGTTFI